MAAEIVGGPAEGGAEVGAANVADKEGVAGEYGVRFCCAFARSKTKIEIDSMV